METTPPNLPIPERIRNRRETLGIAGYELAARSGISPSYLSLIETGAKLPSEEIAVRIAEALGDDPDFYRAWVHATRHPDLDAHMARMQRLASVSSDPELRGRLRRGEPIDEGPGFPRASERGARWARHLGRAHDGETVAQEGLPFSGGRRETISVPLLSDGADPGDEPEDAAEVIETLSVDPRLLPPDIVRPFAYRPGPSLLERVRGAIRTGDVVVLTARPADVDPSGIYAVRYEGRVVLSRVLRHGTTLLLLPADDTGRPVSIDSRDETALLSRLAGAVVTTIRTWRSALRPPPHGRSVRLEGDYLVRDCEWKDPYGWRPIQRPEDMDYLDEHRGMKIRFRLIRDGRVRYLLEMTPEDWRRALGRYAAGRTWRTNGYVVAITRRQGGEYSEEFQARWAGFVRAVRG
jgi:transcriptional regulator with XRE-family HTH domain